MGNAYPENLSPQAVGSDVVKAGSQGRVGSGWPTTNILS